MKLGGHVVEMEEPDLVVIRLRGLLEVPAAESLGQSLHRASRNGEVFLLTLAEDDNFDMSGEARRRFIDATRGLSLITDALVGANFRLKVMGRLVSGAARLLSNMRLEIESFDDEPSARAWLRQRGCVACGASASK